MAHYAFIDASGIVTEVIAGRDENDFVDGIADWQSYYQEQREGLTCRRTSYNTYIDRNEESLTFGKSLHANGKTPLRGCYAGIGYFYDEVNDVFIPQGWTYDAVNDVFVAPAPADEN